jgi:CelD/BcsL family acetyltransferase involved in cellulose biosynthesis
MKRRDGSEPARAAVLANKDSKTKKAQKDSEVADTSSDSDVETALAAEARKKRDRVLKRTLQENGSLERQLADAAAKQKAKLAQLTALRNSYPVN